MRKCLYCDFCSVADSTLYDSYIAALIGEINERKGLKCDSVFIGGGTPTVLGEKLYDVIDAVNTSFEPDKNTEFTVEANPGTVDEKLLCGLHERGVNRLSLGAQSFNDNELKELGRIHSSEDIFAAFRAARKAGFENLSMDIMLSTPKQTIESVKKTLSAVKSLSPEHVSAYSLIVEEGTPFYNMELDLPDEDEEREIYRYTVDFLRNIGLSQYEISNFAEMGFESRHNVKYWTGVPYLGFGAAAASYYDNTRFSNTADIKAYIRGEGRGEGREYIDENERLKEKFMLGLRMNRGVEYRGEFKEQVEKLIAEGLLKNKDGRIMLTERGFDLGNLVFMEFV